MRSVKSAVNAKVKIEIEIGEQPMKWFFAILVALFAVVGLAQAQQSTSQQLPMIHMAGILRLVETIPLPGDGYMDHLAADVKGQRLFISGEAAKSLITVDLRAGKVIHETKGLSAMPKKPVYLPESNEVWVTLTDSSVVAISGTTYEEQGSGQRCVRSVHPFNLCRRRSFRRLRWQR
jgi:hypothetical protein